MEIYVSVNYDIGSDSGRVNSLTARQLGHAAIDAPELRPQRVPSGRAFYLGKSQVAVTCAEESVLL